MDIHEDMEAEWKEMEEPSVSYEASYKLESNDSNDCWVYDTRPGKHTKNYGTSPFLMGKSSISMAIFNSYVCLPEGG